MSLRLLLVGAAAFVGYVYVASARLLARTYTTDTLLSVSVRSDPASLARGMIAARGQNGLVVAA